MTRTTGPRALLGVRAVRHLLLCTALVVAVCATVAAVSAVSYSSAAAGLSGLTARAEGEITPVGDDRVRATWRLPSGRPATAEVVLAVRPPPAPTPATVAYDPGSPARAVVPGARLLADADRATSGMVFAALIAALVVATGSWRLLGRARLLRRPTRTVLVRRVRVQRGLLARSWLETESGPQRWLPVYFDPALPTLPSPTTVQVHGDPARHRLLAVRLNDGTALWPSGRARHSEPPGKRTDNAATPDTPTHRPGLLRQLRVDAATTLPAPLVGLFWSYIDNSAFPGWLAATTITAALSLWLAALSGSDPT